MFAIINTMKKLLIGLLISILLLGTGGFFVLNNLHSSSTISEKEKEKEMSTMLGRSAVLTQTQHSSDWTIYKGHAISFSYPSWATIYPTSITAVMPDAILFRLLDEHLTFSIEVHENVLQLGDLTGFNVRRNSKQYKIVNITNGQNNCSSFEKTEDGVEESIFCVKNGKGVSFVGTGPDKDALKIYLSKIAESADF